MAAAAEAGFWLRGQKKPEGNEQRTEGKRRRVFDLFFPGGQIDHGLTEHRNLSREGSTEGKRR